MVRSVGTILLLLLSSFTPTWSAAQELPSSFPNKPVRLVVPYTSGNTPDILARLLAEKVSQRWGHSMIVDNRPGAAGAIGAESVARAQPDGYTILIGDAGPMIVNPIINSKIPYKPSDFAAVSFLATSYFFIVVNSSLNVNNLSELVALAKAKPGQLSYGSSGVGSMTHLALESLQRSTGTSFLHVTYRGGAQVLAALVAKEVYVSFTGVSNSIIEDGTKSGALKILAVGNATRSPFMPDIPTAAESGFHAVDFPGDHGIYAPAGTSPLILAELSRQLAGAIFDPETAERARSMGIEPVGSTPQVFEDHLRKERAKFESIITAAKIKAE